MLYIIDAKVGLYISVRIRQVGVSAKTTEVKYLHVE